MKSRDGIIYGSLLGLVALSLGIGTGLIGISYPVAVDNTTLMSPIEVERITGNQIKLVDGRVITLSDAYTEYEWQDRIAQSKNRVDLDGDSEGPEVWIYGDYNRGFCGTPWAQPIRIPIIPILIPRNQRLLIAVGEMTKRAEQAPSEPTMIDRTITPGALRAAAAAANVRPALIRDLTALGLAFGDPVFIRAFKEENQLELFVRNRSTGKFDLFRTYPIAAASGELGPKLAEGDGQVPEGFYVVPPSAMKPDSQFHLAFNIGFPNEFDRAHRRTGSVIMVHGNRVSIGCLAMTDEKIEEIYTLCAAALTGGQPYFRVHIFPYRMTAERMAKAAGNPNENFWKNLREGYELFEKNQTPPKVSVANERYVFEEKEPLKK